MVIGWFGFNLVAWIPITAEIDKYIDNILISSAGRATTGLLLGSSRAI